MYSFLLISGWLYYPEYIHGAYPTKEDAEKAYSEYKEKNPNRPSQWYRIVDLR